jgi:endonuclease G, mitochondrial
MKKAIFSLLLLFVSQITYANPTQADLNEIYDFIRKHSDITPVKKVFPRTPFPKSVGAKVTRLAKNILQLDYEGFTIWLNCKRKGAVKFRYNAKRDVGSFKRYKKYHLDPVVPAGCQQKSFRGYGKGFDRGHLVPANHLDHSRTAIMQSNYMTNVLPQASAMNQGAWQRTEEITECYRDIDDLLVIGGVIWGENREDDYFVKSHGVRTPGAYWKVIIRGTGQDEHAIAWIIPNSPKAKSGQLDRYLVSVDELEHVTGEKIPVGDYAKHDKPQRSWMIPRGCDKG